MRNLVIAAALTLGLVALPAVADAGESFQVGVKASTTTLKLGNRLTFTGHVRPGAAAAGHTVKLQEKYAPKKPWRTKDTDRVGRSGKYHLTYQPTTATVRRYRVLMPAIAHHNKGLSKELTVSVYAWSRLTSRHFVNYRGIYPEPKIHINGTGYDDSLLARTGNASSLEYNLDHLCTELRATYGISDASETGAQATVSVESDGSQIYASTFDLGQSTYQDLKLDKPLKIRFAAQSTSTDITGYGAVGTPEVLCTAAFGG
jgi:hypothetical protein